MLAYAADAPRFADRRRSPSALLLIVGAHAVALAAVMAAKIEVGRTPVDQTTVLSIPERKPPPPEPPRPIEKRTDPATPPASSTIDTVKPVVPVDPVGPIVVDPPADPLPPLGPIAGTGPTVTPKPAIHIAVRQGPRFATPDWALKPPYPPSMQAREVEATLKLRLQIDDRGRVVAVDPVGNADPAFLAAARKHLIAKWRYKPATEDGRPVHSSTVVTLRFELEA